jgi:hypothetical protein
MPTWRDDQMVVKVSRNVPSGANLDSTHSACQARTLSRCTALPGTYRRRAAQVACSGRAPDQAPPQLPPHPACAQHHALISHKNLPNHQNTRALRSKRPCW